MHFCFSNDSRQRSRVVPAASKAHVRERIVNANPLQSMHGKWFAARVEKCRNNSPFTFFKGSHKHWFCFRSRFQIDRYAKQPSGDSSSTWTHTWTHTSTASATAAARFALSLKSLCCKGKRWFKFVYELDQPPRKVADMPNVQRQIVQPGKQQQTVLGGGAKPAGMCKVKHCLEESHGRHLREGGGCVAVLFRCRVFAVQKRADMLCMRHHNLDQMHEHVFLDIAASTAIFEIFGTGHARPQLRKRFANQA